MDDLLKDDEETEAELDLTKGGLGDTEEEAEADEAGIPGLPEVPLSQVSAEELGLDPDEVEKDEEEEEDEMDDLLKDDWEV
jgi:hypothetical protein